MSSPKHLSRELSPDLKKRTTQDVEAKAIAENTHDLYDEEESGIDPVYQAKAKLLNDALQEIGMGRYQVSVLSASRAVCTQLVLTPAGSGTCSSSLGSDGSRA